MTPFDFHNLCFFYTKGRQLETRHALSCARF